MWADLAVMGVSSLVKQGVSYMQADEEAKAKRAWQAYKNTMTKLADANNQNSITTNERLMEGRISKQRFAVDRSEYMTSAMAEASAAAEGTGGRSVNMVQFDIERNASMQQANLTADREAQYANLDNQRMNSAFQAVMSEDHTFIPSPNLATYALGFGNDVMKSYKELKYSK